MYATNFSVKKSGIWMMCLFLFFGIANGQSLDEQLAEKFKPILVLDSRDNDQSPKQVEIVGAHQWQNIYFQKTDLAGQILGEILAPDMVYHVGYVPGVNIATGNFAEMDSIYQIGGAYYRSHFEFGGPNVTGSEHDGHPYPGWETIYNQQKGNFVDRFYAHN